MSCLRLTVLALGEPSMSVTCSEAPGTANVGVLSRMRSHIEAASIITTTASKSDTSLHCIHSLEASE